jgi:protein phosphatase
MSDPSESETVEDLPVLPAGAGDVDAQFEIDLAGNSDVGKVRSSNQDHFHVVEFGRYLRTLVTSLPIGEAAEEFGEPGYAFAVADGIGGRAGGEIASRLAIGLLIECSLQTPDWILGSEDHLLAKVMDRFAERFKTVNSAVRQRALGEPELRGMGTTLSVALSRGSDLLVVHVGDSRVYLLRGEKLYRLTRDHAADKATGDPTRPDSIRLRRVLTHAIGLAETGGQPDLYHYKLEPDDRIMLCTDGLTDMADDGSIGRELGRAATAADACRDLIDLALGRGGRDNVTAVVAIYRKPAVG